MLGVDGWEMAAGQWIVLSVDMNCVLVVVYVLKQFTVMHVPFRMRLIELCFFLKLYHGYGFMHLCCQAHRLLINLLCTSTQPRHKLFAWVVFIDLHGESGQWDEIDAIAFF